MSYTREQVVTAARAYLGTPFIHQGRNAEGIDCVGLAARVLSDLGYPFFDIEGYNRTPDPMQMIRVLRSNFDVIEIGDARAGDIYLLRIGIEPRPRHVAIRSSDATDAERGIEPMLIHALAYPLAGRVIEQPVSMYQLGIKGAFRLRGLEE